MFFLTKWLFFEINYVNFANELPILKKLFGLIPHLLGFRIKQGSWDREDSIFSFFFSVQMADQLVEILTAFCTKTRVTVEISWFLYHSDFTWNQFWGFLKSKIIHFTTFRGSEFLHFLNAEIDQFHSPQNGKKGSSLHF